MKSKPASLHLFFLLTENKVADAVSLCNTAYRAKENGLTFGEIVFTGNFSDQ